MDTVTLTILVSVGIPTILATAAYFMKNILQRIDVLETQVAERTTPVDVRQLLSDKLDPINKALEEIKEQNKKLLDLYINLVSRK